MKYKKKIKRFERVSYCSFLLKMIFDHDEEEQARESKKARIEEEKQEEDNECEETVWEIATSDFAVNKTDDMIDSFKDYPSYDHLKVKDYPYMVTATHGPKYDDHWAEGRGDLICDDIEILNVCKTLQEAHESRKRCVVDANTSAMDEMTRLVFENENFLSEALELMYSDSVDEDITEEEDAKVAAFIQTCYETQISEDMPYAEWKKAVLQLFESIYQVVAIEKRGELSLKTPEAFYNYYILNKYV